MADETLRRALGANVFASCPHALFALGPEGRVVDLNEAAARHLGVAREAVAGRLLREFFPSEEAARRLRAMADVITTGAAFIEEETLCSKEGISTLRHSIRRVEGRPESLAIYAICVVTDGPPRPAYAELYEKATDALFALDREGRLHAVNRQAEELSGYPRDSVESVHFTQLIAPDEVQRLADYFAARLAGADAPTEYEVRYRHASGEERWAEVHVSRQASSDGMFQASVRDITGRKRLDARRHDYLHMVGHDVKAPLTVIQGFATALKGGRFGPLAPEQATCVDSILDASRRVRHLMEQFLLAEELDSTHGLHGSSGPAGAAVASGATSARGSAVAKGITLEVEEHGLEDLAVGDCQAVQRIVENLLSNALNFTEPGGVVRFRAEAAEASGERGLRIEVSDTGRGIPEAELPRIFDRFYRGSVSAGDRGSGLGLYIVRRLLEACGGRISVSSRLGEGTRFTVWVPLDRPLP
ncbi:MAG: PAS domain S-box protein [Deltaproteobacteria bacterium]|nr:PAS domain S-box protein [Deltaproteobacteria bacterium]